MINFEKARRQLEAALSKTTSEPRVTLLELLLQAYLAYQKQSKERAKIKLAQFDEVAKSLKWPGGGAELPRPFNHRHLERLYWDLQKDVNGVTVRPSRDKPREDYTNLHVYSKIAKPAPRGKPPWQR